ncbi:MAG: YbjN domain-containing protein [Acidimicrobiales bacterium]
MSERAPLRDEHEVARIDAVVREWVDQWRAGGQVGEVDHRDAPDDRGHYHWLLRVRAQEKDHVTLWLSLRQRTIHVETELMPAPEENREELFRYLLVRNAELREVHLAIGPENGVYLVASVPCVDLDLARLDELVGATLTYVDEIYPTAMSLGLASIYRRRRPR